MPKSPSYFLSYEWFRLRAYVSLLSVLHNHSTKGFACRLSRELCLCAQCQTRVGGEGPEQGVGRSCARMPKPRNLPKVT